MKITIYISFLLIFSAIELNAELYRVFFSDKGSVELSEGSELYESVLNSLSEKTIQRRKINLPNDSLISYKDIPINNNYLQLLDPFVNELRANVKWYNYIVAEIEPGNVSQIETFDFVSKVQLVIEKVNTENIAEYINCGKFEYDTSFNQIQMLNIPELHRYGFTGQGARIGFIDSGFEWLKHKFTDSTNVIGTYDFINRDSIVWDQEGDNNNQENHGSIVMATVAGYENGRFVGIAPNAEFLFAKTEILSSETHFEEDLFAEALIWLESRGADVVNASLTYRNMDTLSYDFEELDGSTTLCSRVVNDASKLGVLCVISAGNSGDTTKTIGSPADADSAITVGALRQDGDSLASFSSNGPNAKGTMKPNLVAQGVSVKTIKMGTDSVVDLSGGTSLSAPLIAGSFTLLKSAFPDRLSADLKYSTYRTGNKYNNPDNRFGYGLPDIREAFNNIGAAISPPNQFPIGPFQRIISYIFPQENLIEAFINVKYAGKSTYEKYQLLEGDLEDQFFVNIPFSQLAGESAVAYIEANTTQGMQYYPRKGSHFKIHPDTTLIQCGVTFKDLYDEIAFEENFNFQVRPNFINNSDPVRVFFTFDKYYDLTLKIYDIRGREVKSYSTSYNLGVFIKEFDVSDLQSGEYIITAEYDNKMMHEKLIIIR